MDLYTEKCAELEKLRAFYTGMANGSHAYGTGNLSLEKRSRTHYDYKVVCGIIDAFLEYLTPLRVMESVDDATIKMTFPDLISSLRLMGIGRGKSNEELESTVRSAINLVSNRTGIRFRRV